MGHNKIQYLLLRIAKKEGKMKAKLGILWVNGIFYESVNITRKSVKYTLHRQDLACCHWAREVSNWKAVLPNPIHLSANVQPFFCSTFSSVLSIPFLKVSSEWVSTTSLKGLVHNLIHLCQKVFLLYNLIFHFFMVHLMWKSHWFKIKHKLC